MEETVTDAVYMELGALGQDDRADAADKKLADAIAEYVIAKANRDADRLATHLRFVREAIERAEATVAGAYEVPA